MSDSRAKAADDERLLASVRTAARILDFSESQILRWERQGFIKAIRVPGVRSKRYPMGEVRSLAARILAGNLERAD